MMARLFAAILVLCYSTLSFGQHLSSKPQAIIIDHVEFSQKRDLQPVLLEFEKSLAKAEAQYKTMKAKFDPIAKQAKLLQELRTDEDANAVLINQVQEEMKAAGFDHSVIKKNVSPEHAEQIVIGMMNQKVLKDLKGDSDKSMQSGFSFKPGALTKDPTSVKLITKFKPQVREKNGVKYMVNVPYSAIAPKTYDDFFPILEKDTSTFAKINGLLKPVHDTYYVDIFQGKPSKKGEKTDCRLRIFFNGNNIAIRVMQSDKKAQNYKMEEIGELRACMGLLAEEIDRELSKEELSSWKAANPEMNIDPDKFSYPFYMKKNSGPSQPIVKLPEVNVGTPLIAAGETNKVEEKALVQSINREEKPKASGGLLNRIKTKKTAQN